MNEIQHDPDTDAPAGPRPLRRAVLVLAALLVLGGFALLSGAFFADDTTSDGMRVTTGRIDLAGGPSALPLDVSGLAPGDVVAVPVTMSNSGSLRLRYALSTRVDDPALGALLLLEVRTGVTSCDAVRSGSDGTVVAGPAPLGTATLAPVMGDPAQGTDPGDRELAAGDAEELCLRIELPVTATEAAAAARSGGVTLRADAEQTAANP